MGLRSTTAMVAHSMRMTDSSKLVTLITDRYGLVKVMARGARRPKSKYGAALEPLTLIDCMFYHKDTREIQTLSEVDIIDSFDEIKSDIRLLSIGACMAEITRSQTPGEDPAAGTFPLLVESLQGLRYSSRGDSEKHLWRYLLRFLATAGYRPNLDTCLSCGKPPRGRSVFLSFGDGGVICSCTGHGNAFGTRVSPGALMVMKELMDGRIEDLPRLKVGKKQRGEVEDIVLKFLAYHTGRSRAPKALAFLRKIENR